MDLTSRGCLQFQARELNRPLFQPRKCTNPRLPALDQEFLTVGSCTALGLTQPHLCPCPPPLCLQRAPVGTCVGECLGHWVRVSTKSPQDVAARLLISSRLLSHTMCCHQPLPPCSPCLSIYKVMVTLQEPGTRTRQINRKHTHWRGDQRGRGAAASRQLPGSKLQIKPTLRLALDTKPGVKTEGGLGRRVG